MSAIKRILARISGLFTNRTNADEDLRAEMQAHLEMETAEYIRRGMRPDEARRRALLASGGITQAMESVHDQRSLPWIEGIAADIRFATRHFRRTPLSTTTMVLVLALGLGTNVVLFTVLNSIATMPAAGIARDEAVVRIRGSITRTSITGASPRLMSWPEVREYAARTDVFNSVAAHADETGVVNLGDAAATPLVTNIIYTTSNYFRTLNLRPVLGTEPAADAGDLQMTTSPTAVISHAMWQQRFGGAQDVIGRTIRINDFPVQIVGVAPQRFAGTDGGSSMTMWVPLAAYPLLQKRSAAAFSSYDSTFLVAFARMRAGITTDAAAPAVAAIAERVSSRTQPAARTTAARTSTTADVVPMLASNAQVSGDRSDALFSGAIAGGLALLALLITCTNVSALMVGLAVARRKEIGVRLSLGAPRSRLVRQLLTESVLLSLIAAAIGLFVTAMGIRIIGTRLGDVQLVVDWRVTIATCAVAIITGILFGLSPAMHATGVSLSEVLKSSSTSVGASRSRLQRALVVAQIALTQPMLVGLGVVIVTMVSDTSGRATAGSPGRIAEIELDAWTTNLAPDERAARIQEAVDRVAAIPGVVSAMPMALGTNLAAISVHPADRVKGITYPLMETRLVAAPKGYFSAFEIPITRGRDFDATEYVHTSNDAAIAVAYHRVIIGSDMARMLWGDADPLGRRFTPGQAQTSDSATMVVIGVVDEKAAGPSEVNGQFRAYVPYSVVNDGVLARTAGPATPLINTMRKAVATAAPQMPIKRAQTMEQRETEARREMLRTSRTIAVGGLLALMLSAIGLYAVVSFGVGQRTREIGIRTALGAQRSQVIRMFFGKGLALSAFGLALGLPLSIIATRMIAAAVNWPMASSPLIGVAIGVVVLMVASVAVWIPARRASTIDPILALRTE